MRKKQIKKRRRNEEEEQEAKKGEHVGVLQNGDEEVRSEEG